jgi:hypothetical protein
MSYLFLALVVVSFAGLWRAERRRRQFYNLLIAHWGEMALVASEYAKTDDERARVSTLIDRQRHELAAQFGEVPR